MADTRFNTIRLYFTDHLVYMGQISRSLPATPGHMQ